MTASERTNFGVLHAVNNAEFLIGEKTPTNSLFIQTVNQANLQYFLADFCRNVVASSLVLVDRENIVAAAVAETAVVVVGIVVVVVEPIRLCCTIRRLKLIRRCRCRPSAKAFGD